MLSTQSQHIDVAFEFISTPFNLSAFAVHISRNAVRQKFFLNISQLCSHAVHKQGHVGSAGEDTYQISLTTALQSSIL